MKMTQQQKIANANNRTQLPLPTPVGIGKRSQKTERKKHTANEIKMEYNTNNIINFTLLIRLRRFTVRQRRNPINYLLIFAVAVVPVGLLHLLFALLSYWRYVWMILFRLLFAHFNSASAVVLAVLYYIPPIS